VDNPHLAAPADSPRFQNAFENIEANVLAVVGSDDLLRPLTERFEVPFHFGGHERKSRQDKQTEEPPDDTHACDLTAL